MEFSSKEMRQDGELTYSYAFVATPAVSDMRKSMSSREEEFERRKRKNEH